MTETTKQAPLFSVLVPVYNAEAYLPACLASVFAQTERDFELILTDDGSADGSGALCDACKTAHPEIVRVLHKENGGLIMARRDGIALARGTFCVFLDADDVLMPEALAVIRKRIEAADADVLIYNFASFSDGEPPVTEPPVFPDGRVFEGAGKREVYAELYGSFRLNNLVTKAIRTALLRADDTPYRDYADNAMTEDLLQSLYPVTHADRIAYCALPLYGYRRAAGSITRSFDAALVRRICDGRVPAQVRRYMALWGMDAQEDRARFFERQLAARMDECLSFFAYAGGAAARRRALSYDWLENLDPAETAAAAKRLPAKARFAYFCFMHRTPGLLYAAMKLTGRTRT